MVKKAQVSIFIILAIAIIVIISLFFLINNNRSLKSQKINPEIGKVNNYVIDCIKNTGSFAIFAIESSGGYATQSEFSNNFGIAYYYNLGEDYMPSINIVEEELSDFMDFALTQQCNLDDLELREYEIEIIGEPETKSRIEEDKVIFDLNYKLKIEKGDQTYSIDRFEEIIVPSKLYTLYNAAYEINQEQQGHNGICLNCVYDIAYDNNLYVELNDLEDGETLFILKYLKEDTNISIEEYSFVNKYEIIEI